MKLKLKTSLSKKKTLLLISTLLIFFGALSCILGEFILPFLTATLAVLYLFDGSKHRVLSISVSVLLLIINVAGFIAVKTISLFAPASIILAFIICFSFCKGESKADAAYIMTIIAAIFSLLMYLLYAMVDQGEYTLDAVKVFYTDFYDSLRTLIVDSFMSVYSTSGLEVTEEMIIALFDRQVSMIISYLLVGGFMVVGVAMKLFSFVVSRLVEDKSTILQWRFSTTNLYAYFYLILTLASVFVINADSIFAISILNLYNVFLIVFAYVGFNFVITHILKNLRPLYAGLILVAVMLLFSGFAVQVLAILGVMHTIRSNKNIRIQNS